MCSEFSNESFSLCGNPGVLSISYKKLDAFILNSADPCRAIEVKTSFIIS
jgi:hypothetical protein